MIEVPYIPWGTTRSETLSALAATRHYIECPTIDSLYGRLGSAEIFCPNCGRYQMRCCYCRSKEQGHRCHRYPVVYVDGACSNNGYPLASSGLGYALGTEEDDQFSIPITEEIDPGRPRTSQRAELLAAMYGLLALEDNELKRNSNDDSDGSNEKPSRKGKGRKAHKLEEDRNLWIVASDSEYLVKGLANLVPKWKVSRSGETMLPAAIGLDGSSCLSDIIRFNGQLRNWKTSTGKDPVNLDLFKNLDRNILRIEETFKIRIKFFWVPREYNSVADQLAKNAAAKATPRSTTNVAEAYVHSPSAYTLRRASVQSPVSNSHAQQRQGPYLKPTGYDNDTPASPQDLIASYGCYGNS
jgi:ribonuclease HI